MWVDKWVRLWHLCVTSHMCVNKWFGGYWRQHLLVSNDSLFEILRLRQLIFWTSGIVNGTNSTKIWNPDTGVSSRWYILVTNHANESHIWFTHQIHLNHEPHLSTNGPSISAKEPCISAKEPCILQKSHNFRKKAVCFRQQSFVSPQKSPASPQKNLLFSQTSPLSPKNNLVSPRKSHVSLQVYQGVTNQPPFMHTVHTVYRADSFLCEKFKFKCQDRTFRACFYW